MQNGERPRSWGFWTRSKLDALRNYLTAYATATKRASERIYLDLFAGGTQNTDRITGEAIESSAQIALSVDNPRFTRLRFFELEESAESLRTWLATNHPDRDVAVYGGDCNVKISEALRDLRHSAWAPSFAFIDPNGLEAKWTMLEELAAFRTRGKKCELFLLFSPQMFTRLLPVAGRSLRDEDAVAISEIFGTEDWLRIYMNRLEQLISGGVARECYVSLMRWRLENALGYRWTHPLELKNLRGMSIYYMIFATSDPTGDKIMRHLYNRAAQKFPQMQSEARQRLRVIEEDAAGVQRLFDTPFQLETIAPENGELYRYQSPVDPADLV